MSNPLPSTRNVTRVFRSATDAQIAEGLAWYADALSVAQTLSVKHETPLDRVSGVIAALSPMNSWGSNVNLADRFLAAGGLDSGYLSLGLAKGRAILAGAPILETLSGDKVKNFHLSILAGGLTDAVCIDRHAQAIALNLRQSDAERPKIKGARYEAFQNAYKAATRILDAEYCGTWGRLYPAQVQAITWIAWRERYWSAGAFSRHEIAA